MVMAKAIGTWQKSKLKVLWHILKAYESPYAVCFVSIEHLVLMIW